jgi:hypothetical protein
MGDAACAWRASGSVERSRRRRFDVRGVVIGHIRKPSLEERSKSTVEGSGLQEQVCAPRRPLHLLAFVKALADHRVYRGFGQE